MKRWEFDVHLSDEKLDKEWHDDYKFTKERVKNAKMIATTWTWPWLWRNDIYIKDDQLYLVPDWCGVYEIIDNDLHKLKKLRPIL